MTTVVPCLTFDGRAEEAINFYVSCFKNSRVIGITRSESDGPIPKGKVMHAEFELDGHRYTAFDGGPDFKFSEAFSLVVTVETQDELDRLWDTLTSSGGKGGPCGWLTDRYGLSWQVIPSSLGRMLSDPAGGDTAKATEAMLSMGKLDITALEAAYRGGSVPAR